MNVDFRHIITLNIASFISFAANADMSHPASSNFSDVFATTTDRYQYSGKEFDRMNGLDLYDFHARQYDPVLGRFTSPDPLSEKYYHISPYAYCANNPINAIDSNGEDWRISSNRDKDGTFNINMTVTGVIYNASSTTFDMDKLRSEI